jgi:hypothetical protein
LTEITRNYLPPRPHFVPWYVGTTKSKQATLKLKLLYYRITYFLIREITLAFLFIFAASLAAARPKYDINKNKHYQNHSSTCSLFLPPEPPPTTTRS